MRTGLPTRCASRAAWMARIEGYSSLPPKPPPVSAWMTTACAVVQGQRALERLVDVVRALQRAVMVMPPSGRGTAIIAWFSM